MTPNPPIVVCQSTLEAIQSLRDQFLQEINCQIRYDSCHLRHWADEYVFTIAGEKIGYGSIKGKATLADRDAVFEFYILPTYRQFSPLIFSKLLKISKAVYIECQSNDPNLTALLYEFSHQIYSDVILFEDHLTTNLQIKDLLFRRGQHGDDIFGKPAADEGEYVLEKAGVIVADGGFLLHYNKPFADLYMETAKVHQLKGYASYILQELKKECYKAGRVPAARCLIKNKGSRAALLKAGMRVCGYMLTGLTSK